MATPSIYNPSVFHPAFPIRVGNSFAYTAAELPTLAGLVIPPGSSVENEILAQGSILFPWLHWSQPKPVVSYGVFLRVSSDNAAGETWELRLDAIGSDDPSLFYPAPLVASATYLLQGSFVQMTRTHPTGIASVSTILTVGSGFVDTELSGGGSVVTNLFATQYILPAEVLFFDIKNTGATSTFTIDDVAVWGIFGD